jgi:ABC-type lipoprotein export system ATPase subunit
VVFNGFYGVTPCAIRYDQLVNVVKYFPKVKIIQPELRDVIPNTVQDAFTQITAILNKYPEKGSIKAIWSAWDIPQLGATQALSAAGRTEIRTYGVDGSPEVLQLVADANSPARCQRRATAGRDRPHRHPQRRQAARRPDAAARDLRSRTSGEQGECRRGHQEARHRLRLTRRCGNRRISAPSHRGSTHDHSFVHTAGADRMITSSVSIASSKRFGGAQALAGASLAVHRGTVHGLVGQNGAGKSTLIKILAGLHVPDEGTIEIEGQPVAHLTPHLAESHGIHFIHQDRLLVPTFTVGEALFLGREPRIAGTPFLDRRAMQRKARETLSDYFGITLPTHALISELSTAERQIVQITRALLDQPEGAGVRRADSGPGSTRGRYPFSPDPAPARRGRDDRLHLALSERDRRALRRCHGTAQRRRRRFATDCRDIGLRHRAADGRA